MSKPQISFEAAKNLFLARTPLIDVRAPVEFTQGHLPGAVNLPILNDEERARVGTIYKQQGNAAAVKLGHEIVSGSTKEGRLNAWEEFIRLHPETVIYCFRGGQRSQITQRWLKERLVDRPLIQGGYKAVRHILLSQIDHFSKHPFLLLSGPTGSGKTKLITDIKAQIPAVDLEGIACHRGSAFGGQSIAQPSQVDFENRIAVESLFLEEKFGRSKSVVVEDESRLIGQRAIPTSLFSRLRESPVVWVDESLEVRTENIFKDYILNTPMAQGYEHSHSTYERYKRAVQSISKKLGGLRSQEILAMINSAEVEHIRTGALDHHRVWIEKLLLYYYDPRYLQSLQARQVTVAFRGSYADCNAFLKAQQSCST